MRSPIEIMAPANAETIDFEGWVAKASTLFAQQRRTEWDLAQWLSIGVEKFSDEPQMQMFLDEIGYDKKRALADAKVARLIPPTWRSDKVSFNVCRQLAKIDDEPTRLRMLKQAVDERWNEKTAHHHVVERKAETGQLIEDDDPVTRLSTEIVRCWNRSTPEARSYFFTLAEMAAANSYAPIDEDVAV